MGFKYLSMMSMFFVFTRSLRKSGYILRDRYANPGSASDSRARGPGFDTRSGHILSFLLPLFQERQLSVTGESMYTKYWLTA